MLLLADSGATKTDWRLIDFAATPHQPTIRQLRTTGMNPYHKSDEQILSVLHQEFTHDFAPELVKKVAFYGAGCGTDQMVQRLSSLIGSFFINAEVSVKDDLEAAARALCGTQKGIACILGTGSGVCSVNEQGALTKFPGNGVWLGDEGSAASLGKKLIISYLDDEMPADIRSAFEKRFPQARRAHILQRVYRPTEHTGPDGLPESPAAYFASFSQYLLQSQAHPWIFRLVYDEFLLFFRKRVTPLLQKETLPVHATGGVAFYFINSLRRAASDSGIYLQHVTETPIAGLALYHIQKHEASH